MQHRFLLELLKILFCEHLGGVGLLLQDSLKTSPSLDTPVTKLLAHGTVHSLDTGRMNPL